MVRIGTAGWSIPRPHAERFPGEGAHLERYARVMNSAEINSTFYRPPRASTWLKWAASVPESFRFSVKAPRAITHDAGLQCTPAELRSFLDATRMLGEKLGPILFQLPPKQAFAPTRASAFLKMLRELHEGPVVFEPRHASWFTGEGDGLLREFHVARVAADPARVPQAASPGGWPGLVYYRLHGSPRIYYSAYGDEYLQKLSAAIAGQSCAEAWCIFDNTASGAALGDALQLTRLAKDLDCSTDSLSG